MRNEEYHSDEKQDDRKIRGMKTRMRELALKIIASMTRDKWRRSTSRGTRGFRTKK